MIKREKNNEKQILAQFNNPDLVLFAFLLFLFTFISVVFWTYRKTGKNHYKDMSKAPLDNIEKRGLFMSDIKENDKKKDKTGVEILPHNYDGIQELDNPLPSWWLMTFYITIVFGIGYYSYYEIFDGPTSDQYLAQELEKIESKKNLDRDKNKDKVLLSFQELKSSEKMMETAKVHFVAKCAVCHGQLGEGGIGPNLTDNSWISSKGDLKGILTAIQEGFLQKGMPAWKELIPSEEQAYLAAYVLTLKGTKPPNAKPPQGEEVQ